MRCIVLIVLVSATGLNAVPYNPLLGNFGGLGSNVGAGLGGGVSNAAGAGAGLLAGGAKAIANTALGFGSGIANSVIPGFAGGLNGGLGVTGALGNEAAHSNGANYVGHQYNQGASGGMNQNSYGGGGAQSHNRGNSHKSLTSITVANSDDSHDVGSSQYYNHGQQGSAGYNNYDNGASNMANIYNKGLQRQRIYAK
ncbi:uncharacterized protein LOC112047004 [Bicyclus anynana]|uniref:Uncharacterized protein LOC112047004 n=1 Tax=Bicyclus anynana TaxID=110368 RepID=A0A6J1MVH3_BICAN|nr:uncharacterized protein LOC112047004 [Bicyclus anynana]